MPALLLLSLTSSTGATGSGVGDGFSVFGEGLEGAVGAGLGGRAFCEMDSCEPRELGDLEEFVDGGGELVGLPGGSFHLTKLTSCS